MPSVKRFVCIHGHFYQPPRENPWLETVETQDSAAPYHDWNERVCAECYATNGAARIVNNKNQIIGIVNNYSRMSFNFGPTLLSWLKENAPRTHRMILDGEQASGKHYRGHSSAMAQVYNHIIMPLASPRDRVTQVRWGIADYASNYGHPPEGMWLAETAADAASLEAMAQNGIGFTVLAPHQCKRIRPLRKSSTSGAADSASNPPVPAAAATPAAPPTVAPPTETQPSQSSPPAESQIELWTDTPDASVDTTRPYLARFASGASIAVFFYDGPTSRAIAFEGLLNSGEGFAARLKAGFTESSQPQLVHVATDGESYGHHHKYGDMALAYALSLLDRDKTVKLTNYSGFLEQFPPEYECEIVENTSWSCVHGVERWRSNCGCNGGKPGFNQSWRTPLRQALDELRDALVPLTEIEGNKLFRDVWAARDAYIHVVLDRSPESTDRFFIEHQAQALSESERVRALELMEMQRHAQLMYTSCGWFFDDISGIETVQVIAYAARVLQLAQQLFGRRAAGLEPAFLARLAEAQSNVAAAGDGAKIYKKCVSTMEINLEQVAAHYAISSVFSSFAEETDLYCYRVRRISSDIYTSGRGRLALGRAHVASAITGRQQAFSFAVLHFGDQNITAAVKVYTDPDSAAFEAFAAEAATHVQRADFPEVIRLLDRFYGHADYSLTSLFSDEQRRIIQLILNSTLWDIENSLTTIYQDHASLLHYLSQAGLPKPPALTLAAGFALNAGIRRTLENDPIDVAVLRSYLSLAKADKVPLESATLSYIADRRMKRAMVDLQVSEGSLQVLESALTLARTLSELPFDLNLWQAQNLWYEIFRTSGPALKALSADDRARWDKDFAELGACLTIDTTSIRADEESRAAAD
jgi:alpha-amylase/alpha-mannosidase (GH57 family)